MRDVGHHLERALVFQRLRGLTQRARRIHHVIDQHAGLAFDLADDIHHLRLIRPRPAFVDDGQDRHRPSASPALVRAPRRRRPATPRSCSGTSVSRPRRAAPAMRTHCPPGCRKIPGSDPRANPPSAIDRRPARVIMFATSLAVMATRVARGRRSWRAYPKYGTTAVTRFAEARRQASAIISSSIKFSAGGCVGCSMNTSRPRTFSRSSTLTSPSLNRSTSARPNGTCKCRVISCASAGFALPVNTAIDNELNSLFCDIDLAQIGWGGRIRTSVWRDQNPLPYRLATPQLGKHNRRTRFQLRSAILQARASHSVREP